MSDHTHERARELLALSAAEQLAGQQHAWLQTHLSQCATCSAYERGMRSVVRALRAQPAAVDIDLVRTTMTRVRARALELRRQQERSRLMAIACSFVGLSATITTLALWRGFAWLGAWAGVASSAWQVAFAFLWIAPALVVSTVLLAGGTCRAHFGEGPNDDD